MVDPDTASDAIKLTLKLKASDVDEIVEVERDVAAESKLLAYYMQVFSEDYLHQACILIPDVESETLTKVLDYCKRKADGEKCSAPPLHRIWGYDFFSTLDDRMFNNLIMAAACLQVESLLERSCNHAVEHKPWGAVAVRTVSSEYLTFWEVVWSFFKQKREAGELP